MKKDDFSPNGDKKSRKVIIRPKSRGDNDRPSFKSRDDNDRPSFKPRNDWDNDRPSFKSRDDNDRPSFKPRNDWDNDRPSFKPRGDNDRPSFKPRGDNDRPSFKPRNDWDNDRPSFKPRNDWDNDRPSFKPRGDNDRPSFKPRGDNDRPSFKPRGDNDRPSFKPRGDNDRPSFKPRGDNDRPSFKPRGDNDRPSFKPRGDNDRPSFKPRGDNDRPSFKPRGDNDRPAFKPRRDDTPKRKIVSRATYRDTREQPPAYRQESIFADAPEGVRLNKYLSNAGVASRRKADELIAAGHVTVNGEVVVEMGHRVQKGDKICFEGNEITPGRKVYVLLSKPKDTITTTDDPQGRRTVMDLVARASEERLYPIGRLDRNSTGVLLLTNDGDLAQKLSHPSSEIRKIYNVVLNKPLTRNDFELIMEGVTLEDGLVPVDDLAYPNPSDKHEIGIEIHVGRNRIIRRLFEHLGYEVVKLDRVMYAGLTKQTLSRGDWRYLTEKEVLNLRKMAGVLRK
jgi:23S rRNA pseudouridine2605 synthase